MFIWRAITLLMQSFLPRARYHVHLSQLVQAGAHVVVDEEDQVGHELAAKVLAELEKPEVD